MRKSELINLIENQQIAFQFADGIITFTHLDAKQCDFESDCENVNEMKRCVEICKNLRVVTPDECDETFKELLSWATPDDILILVEDNLLLCIQN